MINENRHRKLYEQSIAQQFYVKRLVEEYFARQFEITKCSSSQIQVKYFTASQLNKFFRRIDCITDLARRSFEDESHSLQRH